MKTSLNELAIFGGTPAFPETLHVGRPNLGNRELFLSRINDMLDRRWFSNNGPFVQEFERKIAEHVGVRHCIAMCNATIALEIAIRAMKLKGEVIIPSFTFVATAHALQWQEITPVFCDIDPLTHTIDPRKVERLITPRTTGIIGVHVWGNSCDVGALSEIAERRNLRLLFDAAHAFSCSHKDQMIGSFGDAEIFSFHATKFFNTFEGGAVVTNNDELAAKIRLMKNFGFAGYDNVIYIGTNGKMSEPCAAMGLASLESIEEFIDVNRRNYNLYRGELADFPGVRLVELDETERNNYQYVVVEIDQSESIISRDEIIAILWKENVIARKYFYPGCHRMEPYRSYYPHAGLLLETTERVASQVLLLPTGTAVGESEIIEICQIIRLAVMHGRAASQRLSHPVQQPVVAHACMAAEMLHEENTSGTDSMLLRDQR
jgi:dTDP-4-amino-4,6-dideoxygalactose transaminase